MDYEKVMQITQSKGVIEVLYMGSPVWIEEISGDRAVVRFLSSGTRQKVYVNDLVEGK